ncbi:MAG TPA: hypothetical protein VNN10_05460 [Dehalococcoidia bacterium]|jgi:hypothetical protein|nr:hypothetical protein [Dehalococcoidia bacterium]
MRAKLTLLSSNSKANDTIIACIRPLGRDVRPSPEFHRRMKLRLLRLQANDSRVLERSEIRAA